MTGTQRQKLQAVFGALLLITVGPVSGLSAGGGALLGQAGNAGNQSLGAGNQPTAGGAGNQPTGGLSQISWNETTEPNASQLGELGNRSEPTQPYAVVTDQPTDPNDDGLYEDVNGDGQVNVVDADALRRHLDTTAVGANWSAYDFTGDNRTDVGDVQWLFNQTRDISVSDSDGDGLPDSYERNVTNTDPKSADSDDDGVIDGAEDWDGDNLTAYTEYRVGTDPRAVDTDGDGLNDTFELRRPGLDPTQKDTDDDGIPDPQDDADGDNLSVVNETRYNTTIGLEDTDRDGLDDGAEVNKYGTDPTDPDTDDDGIPDGKEVRLGTDPTEPDVTSEDGTYEFTETDNESGVSVTVRTAPENASQTTVEPVEPNVTQEFRESSMVRIEEGDAFQNATVTVPFDASGATNASNYAVYTWEAGSNETWQRVNSSVDLTNGTATATVDSFSYFSVFNVTNWEDTVNTDRTLDDENENESADEVTPVDLTFIIDESGSMSGSKIQSAKYAAKRFNNVLLSGDTAAVVGFDYSATIYQGLTSDRAKVNESIERLNAHGGTDTGDGIRKAIQVFEDGNDSDSIKEAILLADGKTGRGPDPVEEAQRAAEQNITINTVGIGDDVDTSELRSIADVTGGDYYETDNAADLPQVFGRIGDTVDNESRLNDSDGDGIPDAVEEADGLTMPAGPNAGQPIDLDPHSADTDDDGLSDGEEISINYDIVNTSSGTTVDITATAVRSNPSRADTDGDGLTDLEERREWTISVLDSHDDAKSFAEAADKENENENQYITNKTVSSSPLVSDTDADGLNDTREILLGTDPGDPDIDNDGQDDGEEVAHGYDPTLFDIRPPTVDISAAGYGSRTPDMSTIDPRKEGEPLNFYYVRGIADDQSGVASSTIIIDGEEFSNGGDPRFFDREIDAGVLGGIEEGLTVTKIRVRASDEHGNERLVLASSRSNGIVEAVKQGGGLDGLSHEKVFVLGTTTGISSGTGQLVGTVDSVVNSPVQTYQSVSNLSRYESLVKNADDIPGLLKESYQRQQQTANPYYRNGEIVDEGRYKDFRRGYYAGLIVFEVAASAAGSSAAAKAKNIKQVQKAASAAKATRAYKFYRAARKKAISAPASRVSSKITRSVTRRVDFDSPVVRKTMAGTRTVGRSVRTARYIADTPNRVLRGLNERGQRRLRAYYRGIRGKDGETDLDRLSGDSQTNFKNALEDVDGSGQTAAQLQRQLDSAEFNDVFSDDVPDDTRNSLLRAQRNGDVSADDIGTVSNRYKQLDDTQRQRLDTLIENRGPEHAKFAGDLDPETLQKWLTPECAVGGGSTLAVGAGAASGSSALGVTACTYDAEFADTVVESLDDTDIDRDEFVRRYENDIGDKATFREATKDLDAADRQELLRITTDVDREYASNIGSGVAEMRSSDAGSLEDFFAFDAGKSAQVRATVLQAVGDSDFDAVTPDRAYQFSDDVQALSSNPDVEGTSKVINEDLTSSNGYVNGNDNNVKGAMYEMRVANGKLVDKLDGDATLKLSYEPDIDFDSLSSEQISDISDETGIAESDIEESLGYGSSTDKNPEFDGFAIESENEMIYYEAKSGDVSTNDIQKKLAFLKGYERLNTDVDSSQLRLNSLEPRSSSKVTGTVWDYLNNKNFGNAEQFDWSRGT
ncbi:vWA domain-containing protein [Haloarcula salinisoli]|uniref:vWA domain-containing protein n=1 Tax=Haloarcula salinisoli TaxID=2487746 RepID=UPI001F38A0DE|nr:vWA domain-containing protein [Halomicroarcula salinisoli]